MNALARRYDQELANSGFETLPPDGWDFQPFDSFVSVEQERDYHLCLSQRTAQCTFALDSKLAVYVLDEPDIFVYGSVFELVRLEKLFAEQLLGHGACLRVRIEPLGHFSSLTAFEGAYREKLQTYQSSRSSADQLNAVYFKPGDVVRIGRFCDSEKFSLYAIRYTCMAQDARPQSTGAGTWIPGGFAFERPIEWKGA